MFYLFIFHSNVKELKTLKSWKRSKTCSFRFSTNPGFFCNLKYCWLESSKLYEYQL